MSRTTLDEAVSAVSAVFKVPRCGRWGAPGHYARAALLPT